MFHDATLDRVSDSSGRICDYTLDQLRKVKIFGICTTGFFDRIITLREFLEKFSRYDISFAIELKVGNIEEETLGLVKEFGIMHKTTFTSFEFDYIRKIKVLDKYARVGWLVSSVSDNTVAQMKTICAEEIALKADLITEDFVQYIRNNGLGIRAWGVSSLALMKKMCCLGVDGMTVNFPDRLFEYLHS